MKKIAVTETIIGIHTAVEAARHAEYAFDNWLASNRTGRNRRAVSPAMKQTGYIENIIRILPRINPAKQTPESCHSLIVAYQELAGTFMKIKQNPATPERFGVWPKPPALTRWSSSRDCRDWPNRNWPLTTLTPTLWRMPCGTR